MKAIVAPAPNLKSLHARAAIGARAVRRTIKVAIILAAAGPVQGAALSVARNRRVTNGLVNRGRQRQHERGYHCVWPEGPRAALDFVVCEMFRHHLLRY